MENSSRKRTNSRGSSFTSCLLAVVIFFGSIGFYYFNYFRWRGLEQPLENLEIVVERDTATKVQFTVRAVTDIIDPGLAMVGKLSQIRKDTKGGQPAYPDMAQEIKEVKIRLLEIMDTAKLRRIPKSHAKHFKYALSGLGQVYQACLVLEEYPDEDSEEKRKKLLAESFKLSSAKGNTKSGVFLLNKSREHFRPSQL